MSNEQRGFLTLEEVPSSVVEQAIAAFFSLFITNPSKAKLIEALRKAPCVLVKNVPMDVGDAFARKLNNLGAKITFCPSNGAARHPSLDKR